MYQVTFSYSGTNHINSERQGYVTYFWSSVCPKEESIVEIFDFWKLGLDKKAKIKKLIFSHIRLRFF